MTDSEDKINGFKVIDSLDGPMIITKINGCDVTLKFKPESNGIDVMEEAKYLILQAFKERIGRNSGMDEAQDENDP